MLRGLQVEADELNLASGSESESESKSQQESESSSSEDSRNNNRPTNQYEETAKKASEIALKLYRESTVPGCSPSMREDSGLQFARCGETIGVMSQEVIDCIKEFLPRYYDKYGERVVQEQKRKHGDGLGKSTSCTIFATARIKSTGKKLCFIAVSSPRKARALVKNLQQTAAHLSDEKTEYLVVPQVSDRYLQLLEDVTEAAHIDKESELKHHKKKKKCAEPALWSELTKWKSELGDDFEVTGIAPCSDYPYKKENGDKKEKWVESLKKSDNIVEAGPYSIGIKDPCDHCKRKRFAYKAIYAVAAKKNTQPLSPRSTSPSFSLESAKKISEEKDATKIGKKTRRGKRGGSKRSRSCQYDADDEFSELDRTPSPVSPALSTSPSSSELDEVKNQEHKQKNNQGIKMKNNKITKQYTKTTEKTVIRKPNGTVEEKTTITETETTYEEKRLVLEEKWLQNVLDQNEQLCDQKIRKEDKAKILNEVNDILENLKVTDDKLKSVEPIIRNYLDRHLKTKKTGHRFCCNITIVLYLEHPKDHKKKHKTKLEEMLETHLASLNMHRRRIKSI